MLCGSWRKRVLGMAEKGCLRCGNCCTQFGVCVTPFDIAGIIEGAGVDAEEFLSLIDDYPEREREEPAVLIDGKMQIVVLKRDLGEVCCFYSKEGCRIYECRPYLCRAYPFIIRGGKLAETKSRACIRCWEPTAAEKKQYLEDATIYAKQVKEYKKIAEEWNSEGGGDFRSFLKFALEKIKEK